MNSADMSTGALLVVLDGLKQLAVERKREKERRDKEEEDDQIGSRITMYEAITFHLPHF